MKRLFILLPVLLVLFVFTSQSLAQNVPDAVKQAFNKKFSNAQQVHWGKESADVFEAEFTLNGKKMSSNFDTNGNWKETEATIAEKSLPDAVKQTLSRDYKGAKVVHAFEITSAGETMYEVEVEMNGDHEMMQQEEKEEEHGEKEENEEEEINHEKNIHELIFTKDGKVVHKTEMNKEMEKDNG